MNSIIHIMLFFLYLNIVQYIYKSVLNKEIRLSCSR